jgi:uncharacterized protein (TIGR03083 family)
MTDDGDVPPRISYAEALELAAVEHKRLLDVLKALQTDDWQRPTDCDQWTVRDLAGHLLGSMHDNGSLPRALTSWQRATRVAKRNHTEPLDESTANQVRAFASLPNDQVATTFARLSVSNLRGRRHIPTVIRRAPITVNGQRYSVGHIFGIVLTRDVWMHRIDLTRATRQALALTPDHDGRIVADITGDWARTHDQPFELHLSGPAGGDWRHGTDTTTLQLDAVEFCRALSGRRTKETSALLAHHVLF